MQITITIAAVVGALWGDRLGALWGDRLGALWGDRLGALWGIQTKGHATRNDIVDDIVDFSSSTMAFNVAKIASARASLTISLTKSLRVAGP